jgi:LmbE family N-acetylglucosaminyl deacetylase
MRADIRRRMTVVAFHAHPDDEALLTGGTLARAAAAGHRVVLVTATAGDAGLAGGVHAASGLGGVRAAELSAAARVLGCARVEMLGYADSGMDGTAGGDRSFARTPPAESAARLADILLAEDADVLTTYDENGGYGHPDHVAVNRVGALAALLAGTPRVLEATVDRTLLHRTLQAMRLLRLGRRVEMPDLDRAYLPRDRITHRVDVRAFTAVKRAAIAAHVSQASGDADRTLSLLLRLPRPVFRQVLGHEWFAEPTATSGAGLDALW